MHLGGGLPQQSRLPLRVQKLCPKPKYALPCACQRPSPFVDSPALQCQICLSTLRDCVALEPCGHNFCAACLSHHFAALLRGGQPLACPMRCILCPVLE